MEQSTGFRQQRETPFFFSWNSASAILYNSVCSAVYCLGCRYQSTFFLLWAQNQVQHDREMSEALKCKGWSDLRTTQTRCCQGPRGMTRSEIHWGQEL